MTTGEGHSWSGTRRRSIFVYFFNKSFAWCSRAEGARGMELRDTKERILMYADDWALIAESAELYKHNRTTSVPSKLHASQCIGVHNLCLEALWLKHLDESDCACPQSSKFSPLFSVLLAFRRIFSNSASHHLHFGTFLPLIHTSSSLYSITIHQISAL
jgi:hypothetical protein